MDTLPTELLELIASNLVPENGDRITNLKDIDAKRDFDALTSVSKKFRNLRYTVLPGRRVTFSVSSVKNVKNLMALYVSAPSSRIEVLLDLSTIAHDEEPFEYMLAEIIEALSHVTSAYSLRIVSRKDLQLEVAMPFIEHLAAKADELVIQSYSPKIQVLQVTHNWTNVTRLSLHDVTVSSETISRFPNVTDAHFTSLVIRDRTLRLPPLLTHLTLIHSWTHFFTNVQHLQSVNLQEEIFGVSFPNQPISDTLACFRDVPEFTFRGYTPNIPFPNSRTVTLGGANCAIRPLTAAVPCISLNVTSMRQVPESQFVPNLKRFMLRNYICRFSIETIPASVEHMHMIGDESLWNDPARDIYPISQHVNEEIMRIPPSITGIGTSLQKLVLERVFINEIRGLASLRELDLHDAVVHNIVNLPALVKIRMHGESAIGNANTHSRILYSVAANGTEQKVWFMESPDLWTDENLDRRLAMRKTMMDDSAVPQNVFLNVHAMLAFMDTFPKWLVEFSVSQFNKCLLNSASGIRGSPVIVWGVPTNLFWTPRKEDRATYVTPLNTLMAADLIRKYMQVLFCFSNECAMYRGGELGQYPHKMFRIADIHKKKWLIPPSKLYRYTPFTDVNRDTIVFFEPGDGPFVEAASLPSDEFLARNCFFYDCFLDDPDQRFCRAIAPYVTDNGDNIEIPTYDDLFTDGQQDSFNIIVMIKTLRGRTFTIPETCTQPFFYMWVSLLYPDMPIYFSEHVPNPAPVPRMVVSVSYIGCTMYAQQGTFPLQDFQAIYDGAQRKTHKFTETTVARPAFNHFQDMYDTMRVEWRMQHSVWAAYTDNLIGPWLEGVTPRSTCGTYHVFGVAHGIKPPFPITDPLCRAIYDAYKAALSHA